MQSDDIEGEALFLCVLFVSSFGPVFEYATKWLTEDNPLIKALIVANEAVLD